ncbi:NAD-dependent epimerase/dehydratase family protein [Cohnella abietis]|uniref:CDP-abequose synthase n=1 Tax=Cohnella abietis TaxID=2507935 RepID=A0A3T1DDC4_9BACL|nr:NAD(P)-dependent oxidoreductase [Cohnella abietis]BBI36130.1 CDP-abequose synthase [Cohnella abietis]
MSSSRVVVTGGTGFIGSKLCEELLSRGVTVYAVVRSNSSQRTRLLNHSGLIIVEGDLNNVIQWSTELKRVQGGFDVFYHLAWEGVGNKYRNDQIQINNLNSLLETIKLAKELGCSQWIGTGSQAEYGPLNEIIQEEAPNKPTTLYGATKVAGGNMSAILGRELGIPCQWVRIFSTYGPGDSGGWMLIDVIGQLLDGVTPKLTLGEQLWDYLHVQDAAEALIALAESAPVDSNTYNLGSGSSQTIRAIVETVRDIIDPDIPLCFGDIPYRPDQVMHLEANVDKLREQTGWKPKIDLKNGLNQTVEYIRNSRLAQS